MESEDRVGYDEDAGQSGGRCASLHLRGGARRASRERHEAGPGTASGRVTGQGVSKDGHAHRHAHSHDFLLLFYFERGGGSLRLGEREWAVEAGGAYVIAPGEVVGIGDDASGLHEAEGWTVFFPPEVLGSQAPGAFLSWRAPIRCSSRSSGAWPEAPNT